MSYEPEPLDRPQVRMIQAEGARCGVVTCPTCRALLIVDPADEFDTFDDHMAWHRRFDEEAAEGVGAPRG